MEPAAPPLIVTLQLDAAAQQFFTAQRSRYFPAHLNYLDAHLTLFHHLPSANPAVQAALARAAAIPGFPLTVTGLHNMGNGVAYTLQSAVLQRLHQDMQAAMQPWLIRQDQQRLWPHVTIQNKVTGYKALRLQQGLLQAFVPFEVQAVGLQGWYYRKGPWDAAFTLPFLS